MCTGIEPLAVAAAGASAAGGVIQAQANARNARQIAAAQNKRLEDFLGRNRQREEEAAVEYGKSDAMIQPDQMAQSRADAEGDRAAGYDRAIETGDPGAALPIRKSAASVIGNTYKDAVDAQDDRTAASNAALAKTNSFGDSLFGLDLMNSQVGRKLGSISSLARDDASMLPTLQELAAAQVKRPGMFGSLLQGLGNFGASYFGSR